MKFIYFIYIYKIIFLIFNFLGDTSSSASLESLDLLSGAVASNGSVQSRRYMYSLCVCLVTFLFHLDFDIKVLYIYSMLKDISLLVCHLGR